MKKVVFFIALLMLMIPTAVSADSVGSEVSGEFGAVNSEFDLKELEFDIKSNEETKMGLNIDGEQSPDKEILAGFLSYPDAINNINILDLTGKGEGWKLTLEATPLKNETYEFPKGSLSLSKQTETYNDGMEINKPNVSFKDGIVIDDGQVVIANAESETGMGSFNIEFGDESLILSMDNKYSDDVESGLYYTTLKWQLKSSDGNSVIVDNRKYELHVDEDYLIKEISEDTELPDTSGEPLPSTATNIFNMLLIGTILMSIGIFFFILLRKKESEEDGV